MNKTFRICQLRATEADLILYKACFERNDTPKTISTLRWMYLKDSSPIVSYAYSTETKERGYWAGIYATLKVRFRINSGTVDAVQSLDTLTDKNFRNRGLFTLLANDVYARCEKESIFLTYGFPNANAAPGRFGTLGWKRLDPVPSLILPMRTRFFLRKIPVLSSLASVIPDLPLKRTSKNNNEHGFIIREVKIFDPDVNRIWMAFSKNIVLSVDRNYEYLNWRFFHKPNTNYRILGCYDASGNILGFVALSAEEKHGGIVGYILELMFYPEMINVGDILTKSAISFFIRSKCDVVLAWCFDHSPSRSAYTRSGFFRLPERFRPIELHFGARGFSLEASSLISKRENWYISYADSDTV